MVLIHPAWLLELVLFITVRAPKWECMQYLLLAYTFPREGLDIPACDEGLSSALQQYWADTAVATVTTAIQPG